MLWARFANSRLSGRSIRIVDDGGAGRVSFEARSNGRSSSGMVSNEPSALVLVAPIGRGSLRRLISPTNEVSSGATRASDSSPSNSLGRVRPEATKGLPLATDTAPVLARSSPRRSANSDSSSVGRGRAVVLVVVVLVVVVVVVLGILVVVLVVVVVLGVFVVLALVVVVVVADIRGGSNGDGTGGGLDGKVGNRLVFG